MTAEPFRPDPLLRPERLLAAATFDDARELVDRMLEELDADILANLLEHAVDKTDRAHAVVFELVTRLRFAEQPRVSGVELVAGVHTANLRPARIVDLEL